MDKKLPPLPHGLTYDDFALPVQQSRQQSWIGLEAFRTNLKEILDPYMYGIMGHRLKAEIEYDLDIYFNEKEARRIYIIPFGVPANVRIAGAYADLNHNSLQERNTVQVRMTTAAIVGNYESSRQYTYLGAFGEWNMWYDKRDPRCTMELPRLVAVRGTETVSYYPHYQSTNHEALREACVRACAFNLSFSNPE